MKELILIVQAFSAVTLPREGLRLPCTCFFGLVVYGSTIVRGKIGAFRCSLAPARYLAAVAYSAMLRRGGPCHCVHAYAGLVGLWLSWARKHFAYVSSVMNGYPQLSWWLASCDAWCLFVSGSIFLNMMRGRSIGESIFDCPNNIDRLLF